MNRRAYGIAMIDVLIVIVTIALVVALIFPVLLRGREQARRTECQNKLRQLGVASTSHLNALKFFPSDGWGYTWVGDPERGRGKNQPGSWAFAALDYLEDKSLSVLVKGQTGVDKAEGIVDLCHTPATLFACPARREAQVLPIERQHRTMDAYRLPILKGARSDYAINTGDTGDGQAFDPNPKTLEELNKKDVKWYDTSRLTGISFGRSEVKLSEVTDGTSKTYLIGEKTVNPAHYLTGRSAGDNETMYSGFDDDSSRSAAKPPQQDGPNSSNSAFGSAHAAGWNVVFCDGSVHSLSYSIDKDLHKRLANRKDGQTVELTGVE